MRFKFLQIRLASLALMPGLLFISAAGVAQYRPSDRAYGDRDGARRDRAVFDQTRIDLDRASGYPYSSRQDRKRFDEARRELFDFESRFDQGRYEKHELDQAIDRVNKVVIQNSLDPRHRGALEDDLRRMRDYRAFREHGGYTDGYRR